MKSLDLDKFTIAWIIWIAWFFFWEIWALIDRDNPETFSEHIWAIRNMGSFSQFIIVAMALWVAYHFCLEGRG